MTNFLSDPFENATVSSVDVVNSEDGAYRFGNENLASFNFDGAVPTVLDDAFEAQYLEPGMYFVVPGTDDTLRSVVEVSLDEDDPLDEMTIVYVGENSLLSTYTCDGSDLLTVQYESWDERVLGTQGWTITAGGNAIFANAAIRGRIEAEEGYISGSLTIGAGGSNTFNDLTTEQDVQNFIDDLNDSISASIDDLYLNIDSFSSSLVFLYEAGFVSSAQLITTGATQINGNNITTGVIDANIVRITSASSLVQNRGVQLSAIGLEGYNNAGQRTFFLNTDGSLTIGSNASIDGYVTDGELSSASSSLNSTIDTINERISASVSSLSSSVSSLSSSLSDLSIDINSISASVDFLYNAGFVTDSDLVTNGGTSINGNNITTGTINANLVEITSDLTQNRGVKITSLGLTAYNSSGQTTFNINSGTGAVTITGYATDGELTSGLSNKINNGAAATDINNNITTISGGKITTGTITANQITANGIFGRTVGTNSSGQRVVLSAANNAIDFYDSTSKTADIAAATFRSTGGITVNGMIDSSSFIEASTHVYVGGNIFPGGTSSDLYLMSSAYSGYLNCRPVYDRTPTATPANVVIGSGGRFVRSTSSERYKDNLVPLTDNELLGVDTNKICSASAEGCLDYYDVLLLSPTQFIGNDPPLEPLMVEKEVDGEIVVVKEEQEIPRSIYLGFVAEDVLEKFPVAAQWDEDGVTQSYDSNAILAAVVAVVQDQQKIIEDLQNRVLQLESQLGG